MIGRASILTYGCQMNEADSSDIGLALREAGYGLTSAWEQADLVVLNTCAIREKAEDRIKGTLGQLRAVRAKRPWLVVGVMGCMAAQSSEYLEREADFVIPPLAAGKLPEVLAGLPPPPGVGEEAGDLPPLQMEQETEFKRYLPIIRGCDYRCTFCVVPNTRGPEMNEPAEPLLAAVDRMSGAGVLEITLLGQTVNAYRHGEWDFARLLETMARRHPHVSFRFLTSHPRDFTDRVIEAMASNANVMPYLHLPLQSGSDKILRRMKRLYSVSEYLAVIERARAAIPTLAVSTDIICGFPGETEEDFELTLEAVRRLRYDSAFMFYYSERPGTPAVKLGDKIPVQVRKERLARLIEVQKAIQHEVNQRDVASEQRCLVERVSRRDPEVMLARTPGNKSLLVRAPRSTIGSYQRVRIERADSFTLYGEISFQPISAP
ncbi:MAG: tRNA (N6-isopentenyl adenosine(37)-C2)-methylthiotransferase MiaB [Candidatus Wallbacteria bacterium]|nr:tRNA (N6-isopentenyl adenosine(37)-C2)-methylthiotransferase MiaB [Candidatus Wallbacteria bacterium]